MARVRLVRVAALRQHVSIPLALGVSGGAVAVTIAEHHDVGTPWVSLHNVV